MVDVARQLLDELMGRNRNLDPSVKNKELNWEDEEVSVEIERRAYRSYLTLHFFFIFSFAPILW